MLVCISSDVVIHILIPHQQELLFIEFLVTQHERLNVERARMHHNIPVCSATQVISKLHFQDQNSVL